MSWLTECNLNFLKKKKCFSLKAIYVFSRSAGLRLETAGRRAECRFTLRCGQSIAPEDECCFIVPHCAKLITPVTSVTSTAPCI